MEIRGAPTVALLAHARRCQHGVSLIELIVALAIGSLISGGAVIAIHQILTASAQANDMQFAVSQVRAAEHWMARDALMAQNITYGVDSGFPLVLTWTDFYGDDHIVQYSLTAMPSGDLYNLTRQHTGVGGVSELQVASCIDASQSFAQPVGDPGQVTPVLHVNLVATARNHSATRAFDAMPRAD
jgi:prepilin-type N-terminal cleavage/methylation domain-containing protein